MDETDRTLPGLEGPDLSLKGGDAELVRHLVAARRTHLSNLKSNPKGMTHGDVQQEIVACTRILEA